MGSQYLLFNDLNFLKLCKKLARKDAELAAILKQHGYPPMWTRPATFQTLILTILEQQVSLASAYAAFKKLKDKIGFVTPVKVLALTDEELRSCYFSRQKIIYARHLAESILNKQLNLTKLALLPDETVRTELKKIKGIGDWTVDVYLMMVLQRTDLFPLGDIALVNSLKEVKGLHKHTAKEELLMIADRWKPYRTVAAYLLWHAYIRKRKMKA